MLGHFLTTLVLLFSTHAFATLTYSQSSGASAVNLTTPTKPIIYGGFAGTCSGSSTTCDTCTGDLVAGTGLVPCNPNNVMSTTPLSIVVNSSVALTAAPEVHITSSTGVTVGAVSWTSGATSFTFTADWADICSKAPTNADSSCKKDIDLDLYISTAAASGSTSTSGDSLTISIVTRYVDTSATASTTWNYIDCGATDTHTAKVGFCHFKAYPGDSKVYADELAVTSTFPASENSSALFKNLIFFYEKQLPAESNATTLGRITNASGRFQIGVDTTTSPPVADTRLDGLVNGSTYCFKMATQDATGIINYYTPSTVADTELCAAPSEVVGLLDNKDCFIATAAFGSDMAPEVQLLREFRNKFLLPFSWGKSFVKFYYKHSPKYASMIAGHEDSKTIVRFFLWPLIYMAKLLLDFGLGLSLLSLVFGFLLGWYLWRITSRRRKLEEHS